MEKANINLKSKKKKLFVLRHVNWSMMEAGEWEQTQWIIYDDQSVDEEVTFCYREVKQKRTYRITRWKLNKIIKLIEKA